MYCPSRRLLNPLKVSCLLALLGAGCEFEEHGPPTDAEAETETPSLFCGAFEWIDPVSGDTFVHPETYYPRAIINALAAYGRSPSDATISCEEARTQVAALRDLYAQDPGPLDRLGGNADVDV